MAIDIDDVEKAQEYSEIYNFLKPSIGVWHGKGSQENIISGKMKGTIIYRCSNPNLKSTSGKFVKKYGFEVLYGKRTVQLFGKHPQNEDYCFEGGLREIDEKFLAYLISVTPRPRERKKKGKQKELFQDEEIVEIEEQEELSKDEKKQKVLEEIVKTLLPRWDYSLLKIDGKFQLVGYCPFEDQHSGDNHDSDFDISLLDDRNMPLVGCHHHSCYASVSELYKQIIDLWIDYFDMERMDEDLKAIKIEKQEEITKEITSIKQALESKAKHITIEAATGSGKTYQSAIFFLECLKKKQPVCYVASNRTDLAAFAELIQKLSGLPLSKLHTQILQGGEQLEEEIDKDGVVKINKSTIGIITHHTYLKRKGISHLFYSFFGWIQEKEPIEIIDEADNYLNGLTIQFEIGARYKRKQQKGAKFAIYEKISTCQKFSKSGNCGNCYYYQYQEYQVNQWNIPYIYTKGKITQKEWEMKDGLDYPDITITTKIFIKNKLFQKIEQHQGYIRKKPFKFFLKRGAVYEEKSAIRDIIESAYNPIIYKEFPLDETGKIILNPKLEADNNKKIKWPYQPCLVPRISCKDMAPLEWLRRHAKKTRWLCAKIGPTNKDFLKYCLGEVTNVKIETSAQKIDELLIIGFQKRISFVKKHIPFFQDFEKFGKILIFCPKKSDAKNLYKKLPKYYPSGCYREDSVFVEEKFAEGKWKALITHSRGPLGRAVNLPQFFTCIISANIFRPAYSFDLEQYTEEEIFFKMQEDRITHIIQNAGRILRGNQGRKVIIVHSCTEADLVYLRNFFYNMVRTKIKSTYFQHSQIELKKTALCYHKTGEVINNEKTYEELAKEKANIKSIPIQERTEQLAKEIATAKSAEKQREREEKLIEKAKNWKGTWRAFVRSTHLDRLMKENLIDHDFVRRLPNYKEKKENQD